MMDEKGEKVSRTLSHERESLPQVGASTMRKLALQNESLWKRLGKALKEKYKEREPYVFTPQWEIVKEYVDKLPESGRLKYSSLWDWIHFFIFPSLGIVPRRLDNSIFLYGSWADIYFLCAEDAKKYLSIIRARNAEQLSKIPKFSVLKKELLKYTCLVNKFNSRDQFSVFLLHDGKTFFDEGFDFLKTEITIGNEAKTELREACQNSEKERLGQIISRYNSLFCRLLEIDNKSDIQKKLTNDEIYEILCPSKLETCIKCAKLSLTQDEKKLLTEFVTTTRKYFFYSEAYEPKECVEAIYEYLYNSRYYPCLYLLPTEQELVALLYCYPMFLSKRTIPKIIPSSPVVMSSIRYVLAQYMLITGTEYARKFAQGVSYQCIINELYTQLSLNPVASPSFYKLGRLEEDEKYTGLRSILGNLCNDDTQELIPLLYMLARIVLGKYLYKSITENFKHNVIVVYCNNPCVVGSFLQDLLSSHFRKIYQPDYTMASFHPLRFFINKSHIPSLLREKLGGISANITIETESDSSLQPSELHYLNKLLNGKKVVVSDKIYSSLSYRHTSPCIYITKSKDFPSFFKHASVHLSGDIDRTLYPWNLTHTEATIFMVAAVRYVLDSLNQPDFDGTSAKLSNPPDLKEALKMFIDTFGDKAPCVESWSAQEIKEYLESPDAFYVIKEDLRLMLEDWYDALYKVQLNLKQQSLREPFGELFSPLLYKKKDHIIRKYGEAKGKNTDALVLYGIKVRYEEFEKWLEELTQGENTIDPDKKREEFDAFFDELILKGEECIAEVSR